jgi:ubiquitin-protein ligase E3 A
MVDDCWSRGDAIRRGFLRVVGCPALSLCSADELELMLCGSPDVGDFNELKYVTRYMGGYTLDDNAIKWFWEVVLDFPETMKRKLLLFVTGSDRVPIKGLKCLPFNIQKSGQDSDRLPTAHSCFNILDLPEYTSKEILEKRLEIALQHTIGFGLA